VFKKPLGEALRHALAHLENLDRMPAAGPADLATLRRQLQKPLLDEGLPAEQVVAELVRDTAGGLHATGSGRFFGWVIGGTLPAALAADWLTSAWDQNAGLYTCAPAAGVVEEVAGAWLKEILGLPAGASFALVTGCQAAHLTCLAAARHAVLARTGWDVETHGLYGAPRIRILATGDRHGSVMRAFRFLGMGTGNVEDLQVEALERESGPTIVVLQAGELNTGAFDDFETWIPLARRHGAWVHVDGAFGLWAAASPRYRQLLRGVEAADSWATDGHKWLNVPYDCGYAFVADAEAHRASLSLRASYLTHDGDARDQIDWNLEWSRRARGFATYAALRELGRRGVADVVERCCHHAHAIVTGIGRLRGAELLWEPTLNQGLVRFPDLRPGASEADHDRHTDEVIAAIVAEGEAFFGGATWRGRRAMRVSVCNWQTNENDVKRVVNSVAKVLG
jgi:glutamate/tyrosine decarboxylase-like PLP-dependent enzyme